MYESGTRTGEDALIRNIIHHWKLRPSCLLSLAHTPGTTPVPATMNRADEATVADRPRTYPANLTTLTGSPVEALDSPTPTHVGSTANASELGGWVKDHAGSGPQGATKAEGGDENIIEGREHPSSFSMFCGHRVNSSLFILKSRRSKIPKADQVPL